MVDASGHFAFGLLFALPAWIRWPTRQSVVFAVLAGAAALAPDVDVWLEQLFPAVIHHHGVTHTVVFVVAGAILGGLVVAGLVDRETSAYVDARRFLTRSPFRFATAAFLVGGLSHLVADMLSAPDISTPLEPFWPLLTKPWSLDLVWYDAWWINVGFLGAAVTLHGVAYAATVANADGDAEM